MGWRRNKPSIPLNYLDMAAALAALPTILQLITLMAPGFTHLIKWVMSLRLAASQSREWTEEMETAFITALIATKTDPAYTPDPPPVS